MPAKSAAERMKLYRQRMSEEAKNAARGKKKHVSKRKAEETGVKTDANKKALLAQSENLNSD